MQGEISMNTAGVLGIAKQCYTIVQPMQEAANSVADGWTPRSDPEFKRALLNCRRRWVDAFNDLRDSSQTTGDNLTKSANAVSMGDITSADQF